MKDWLEESRATAEVIYINMNENITTHADQVEYEALVTAFVKGAAWQRGQLTRDEQVSSLAEALHFYECPGVELCNERYGNESIKHFENMARSGMAALFPEWRPGSTSEG